MIYKIKKIITVLLYCFELRVVTMLLVVLVLRVRDVIGTINTMMGYNRRRGNSKKPTPLRRLQSIPKPTR